MKDIRLKKRARDFGFYLASWGASPELVKHFLSLLRLKDDTQEINRQFTSK